MKKTKLYLGRGQKHGSVQYFNDIHVIDLENSHTLLHVTGSDKTLDFAAIQGYPELESYIQHLNQFVQISQLAVAQDFAWLEASCELVQLGDSQAICRYFYLGGQRRVAGSSAYAVPYGVYGNNLEKMVGALETLGKKVPLVMEEELNYEKNVISLGPLSAGIFIHEALGHLSETDIFDEQSGAGIKARCVGLAISDHPTHPHGANYARDDAGVKGITIDLLKGGLTPASGNTFINAAQNGLYKCIRQRNMVVEALPSDGRNSSVNNLLILQAGLNKGAGSIDMICLHSGKKIVYLRMPVESITALYPLEAGIIQQGNVCSKNTSTHMISISSCGIGIEFNRSVKELVLKEATA